MNWDKKHEYDDGPGQILNVNTAYLVGSFLDVHSVTDIHVDTYICVRILKEEKVEVENKIVSIEMEVERVRRMEERFENLNMVNVDLENQLSVAKIEIKKAFQKVFVLEMELEVGG
ncbi:hypothetical protein L2E82_06755 [Cichorium intybus]|uniref:Uncharacterized protein n=1 Tax=Cichorium intybus TaxID=13427 RepID=A0ACB9HAF2_CICIN|nr:hypothetical protein L2E82_06755 [Cichorium intybus]